MAKSADELSAEYGYWGEHARYPLSDWRSDVADGTTRLGYWEWMAVLMADDDQQDDAGKVG